MDCNEKDAQTKPLISSMKPEKQEIEERVLIMEDDADADDDDEYDESERLLPTNGGISEESPKSRRKVQWNDSIGNNLVEILEFQPSDVSDSDEDDSDSCFCTIM